MHFLNQILILYFILQHRAILKQVLTHRLIHLKQIFKGTANVLEAIRKNNLSPVIHVCSSSEVFGRVSQEKLPIDEECGFHPASPYAISKVGTDLIGRYYAEAYDMTVMTTRMFTHTKIYKKRRCFCRINIC